MLTEAKAGQRELPVLMPMAENRDLANQVYDEFLQSTDGQAFQGEVSIRNPIDECPSTIRCM